MFYYSIMSLLSTLGAAATAALIRKDSQPKYYLARVLIASPAAAVGVLLVVFAAGGFGWGWPDPSTTFLLFTVASAGVGIGLFHVAFAWIASRRLSLRLASAPLIVNPIILSIPVEVPIYRIVPLGLANFVLIWAWLTIGHTSHAAE